MSAPVDHSDQQVEPVPQSTAAPNWTIYVSDVRKTFLHNKIVKVSNISLATSEMDIREFFSFSGDIQYIEMERETESTQIAYVTFKDSKGADTSVLLTGAKIADHFISITPVENYQLPHEALPSSPEKKQYVHVVKKGEDVVSTMLAKGFILGKDAINSAKSFDKRHHLTSNASAAVASIDHKIGLSEKLSIETTIVNEKVREMDERFQVSEMTKSAFAVAKQKASSAGSALMSKPYILTGASWVSSAFTAVAKAAEDVSMMTTEKVERADVEKKEIIHMEREGNNDEYRQMHSAGGPPVVPVNSDDDSKLGII